MPEFIRDALVPIGLIVVGALSDNPWLMAMGASMLIAQSARDDATAPHFMQDGFGASVRQPAAPWQIIYGRRRVSGIITYAELGPNGRTLESVEPWLFESLDPAEIADTLVIPNVRNRVLHLVITFAGHPCEEIETIYFDDYALQLVQDDIRPAMLRENGRYYRPGVNATPSNVYVEKSTGDEAPGVQPFPALQTISATWSAQHCQTARTKIHIELWFNPDLFPTGLPNITATIKGAKDIRDPRDDSVGYSTNAALCRAHYLTNTIYGVGADFDTEVDQDQLIAAANECDELVAVDAGGSEPRYTLNGAFNADAAPEDVLGQMHAACAGYTVKVGATWQIFVGGYEAPTLILDEGDLAGPINVQANQSRSSNCNSIQSKYTDPTEFQPVETPPLVSDTFIAQDGGEQIWRTADYSPFVTSGTQAQRLQKIELFRTRQGLTVNAPWKLKALRALTGRQLAITFAKYGWAQKPFEIQGFSFSVAGSGDALQPAITLQLRETAAAIYDWTTSEEQTQDLSPNSDLPDALNVNPPGAPMISEVQYDTRDGGGVKVKAVATWAAADDPFVAAFVFRYKLASDVGFIEMAPRATLKAEVLDIQPGTYDFEVKAISTFGVSSDYAVTRKEIVGITVAPADITGLSIQAAGGLAILRWDLHPDLFVREGGWIEFRFSPDPLTPTWEESFSIGDAIPGNNNHAALPLKSGSYLVRARAQTGILSVNAATIATKQATILQYVDVNALQEDPSFVGTHSNTAGLDGFLKLSGTGLIDAAPDFDTIVDFDSRGGIAGAGTYHFAAGFDFGSVQRFRLTSGLAGFITNVNDLIDARTGEIDDWEDFDGTAGAAADAYIEVRETDNDPASSATWSAWKRLDAAEFQARGFDFRVQLETADPAYNVLLNQVRVTAAQLYS